MQNRTFLVLLRPIFCEKLKIAPPHRKTAPPQTFGFPNLAEKKPKNFGEDLFFLFYFLLENTWFWAEKTFEFPISAEKSVSISVKTFCFIFVFFLETTWFWAENTFEFPSFPRNFVSILGQTVWNRFKNNENSGQVRLHFSHSFKIAPPLFQILATRLLKSPKISLSSARGQHYFFNV